MIGHSMNPKALNGLDVEAMRMAVATVGAQPEAARARKAARVRWVERLKFRAYVRNHTSEVDEPSHLAGEDASPTSMEYVLGALGTCLATGFVLTRLSAGSASGTWKSPWSRRRTTTSRSWGSPPTAIPASMRWQSSCTCRLTPR